VFSPQLSMPQLALKAAKVNRAEIPRTIKAFVRHLIRRGWSSDRAEWPSSSISLRNCGITSSASNKRDSIRRKLSPTLRESRLHCLARVQFSLIVRHASKIRLVRFQFGTLCRRRATWFSISRQGHWRQATGEV
jgi:hypothetical protein